MVLKKNRIVGKLYSEIHYPGAMLFIYLRPGKHVESVGHFFSLTDGIENSILWSAMINVVIPERKYRHRIIRKAFKVKL